MRARKLDNAPRSFSVQEHCYPSKYLSFPKIYECQFNRSHPVPLFLLHCSCLIMRVSTCSHRQGQPHHTTGIPAQKEAPRSYRMSYSGDQLVALVVTPVFKSIAGYNYSNGNKLRELLFIKLETFTIMSAIILYYIAFMTSSFY